MQLLKGLVGWIAGNRVEDNVDPWEATETLLDLLQDSMAGEMFHDPGNIVETRVNLGFAL